MTNPVLSGARAARNPSARPFARAVSLATVAMLSASVACRPSSILDVPPPLGVISSSTLTSPQTAEAAYNGAKGQLFFALTGVSRTLEWGELLSDEFTYHWGHGLNPIFAGIDARRTAAGSGFSEASSLALPPLLTARSNVLLAEVGLAAYEVGAGQSKAGEAFALAGYSELVIAEMYCAGAPLSRALPDGGVEYGAALTTDSIFGVAEAHFDSALAHASGDSIVQNLARIGLARARLGRGKFSSAADAVSGVPTGFVYSVETEPSLSSGAPRTINMYAAQLPGGGTLRCGFMNVADREGGNGLNFLSSHDPRIVLDSTIASTCDGTTWYYPAKFGNPSGYVPIATGVEARLIEAEAALQAGQIPAWKSDLDALRAAAPSTYLGLSGGMPPLTADSTVDAVDSTRVSVMFRERAFWLFGTGIRLGDMRRLIRQYGRSVGAVFPVGNYPNGTDSHLPSPIVTYGSDVSLTLPTAAGGLTTANPNYHGCLVSAGTP